jgi:hypothetical protein
MLNYRGLGIVAAVAFVVMVLANQAATQAQEAPKGLDLPTACPKLDTLKFENVKEIIKIHPTLKDGSEKAAVCTEAIKRKLTEVLSRKQTWEHANREIDELIEFSQGTIDRITGPAGVRALIELWIDKTEKDKKAAERYISDPPVLKRVQKGIDEDIGKMKASLKKLDEEVKGLTARVGELERKKPEYAFLWYREEQKQIIDAIISLADTIRQQAEAMSKIEFEPKKGPITGN